MSVVRRTDLNRDVASTLERVLSSGEPALVLDDDGSTALVAALVVVDVGDRERYIVAGAPTFTETRELAEEAGPDQAVRLLHPPAPDAD